METSTKERLTGALLVVLAVVIVAPELLSGRHKDASGPPPAQDPEAGAPLQTFDGPVDAAGDMPSATRNVPAEAAAAIAAVPPPVAPDAPSPVPQAVPAPAAAAAAESPKEQAQRSTTTANEAAKPAARPAAKANTATPAAAGAAKWWVQLGSFASRDNAERLAKRLRAAGFSIDVSHSSSKGKELYRVRAGPAADKAAASSLQARLVAAGEKNASVVTP